MTYLTELARPEVRRITESRSFRLALPLLALAALVPLLTRAGWLRPWLEPGLLQHQLLLTLLTIQALLAPVLGGGMTPSQATRHRGLQLLLLTPTGPGAYLLGLFGVRALLVLLLSLVPLPIWLFGAGPFPEQALTIDFWLALTLGPFVFCALSMLAGQTARAEVLGFLCYLSGLALLAGYLWGLRVADELAEIRLLVLLFLLWATWAALIGTRLHFARTLAEPPGFEPSDAVGHSLASISRRITQLIQRLRPRAFEDPLLYLALFRPPAPPIGMAWMTTIWLLFIGCVLEVAFALLPYHLADGGPESVQLHLDLVTAAVCGVLLTPAALAMASFHGRGATSDLLRLAPIAPVEHFRARERAALALSLPLILLPACLQGLFCLDWRAALSLAGLCLAGQLLAVQLGFLFCGTRRIGDGLLGLLGACALAFVIGPTLGAPTLRSALQWGRATLPDGFGLAPVDSRPPVCMGLMLAAALLLALWQRRRFSLPPTRA